MIDSIVSRRIDYSKTLLPDIHSLRHMRLSIGWSERGKEIKGRPSLEPHEDLKEEGMKRRTQSQDRAIVSSLRGEQKTSCQ